jgi:methylenetetrahydrofolate--tRNA-(uracil-5-)-methyltransferase
MRAIKDVDDLRQLATKWDVTIVGAGLAGSECAFQLASKGFKVGLVEMRPEHLSPAHKTPYAGELVCSNSFGSLASQQASGQLKWEAEKLDSLILKQAYDFQVPAGQALAVDRQKFSESLHKKIVSHPLITFIPSFTIKSLEDLPRPAVIATGPLTDPSLSLSLQEHFGDEFLYFFDAIAPIIATDSIDFHTAWKQSRYDKGGDDYINCPLTEAQYFSFIEEIQKARKIEPKDFEKTPFFESCMPIEVMVERGPQTLRFGPLKPVGLKPPLWEKEPYAVVQLRQDNTEGTAYNMVGFQTRMAYGEQVRIFRQIPGLEQAEFLKLGSLHRNLYLHTPQCLNQNLSSKKDPLLFFAGQITGVEGYFESTCMGLLVSYFVTAVLEKTEPFYPPRSTALGALLHAITEEKKHSHFQPTNINFGLLPEIQKETTDKRRKIPKKEKRDLQIQKAQKDFLLFYEEKIKRIRKEKDRT